jgi:hypothetical protein
VCEVVLDRTTGRDVQRNGEIPTSTCARGELNPHALSGTRT